MGHLTSDCFTSHHLACVQSPATRRPHPPTLQSAHVPCARPLHVLLKARARHVPLPKPRLRTTPARRSFSFSNHSAPRGKGLEPMGGKGLEPMGGTFARTHRARTYGRTTQACSSLGESLRGERPRIACPAHVPIAWPAHVPTPLESRQRCRMCAAQQRRVCPAEDSDCRMRHPSRTRPDLLAAAEEGRPAADLLLTCC